MKAHATELPGVLLVEPAVHRDDRGAFFTLILQPPRRVERKQAVGRELIFVLDTSGSMDGYPITQIWPYDAEGNPVDDVFLFDQSGNPISLGEGERFWAEGEQNKLVLLAHDVYDNGVVHLSYGIA